MKTKKAIRLIREGKIQVEADTTKINKFLKKAFPNDSCSPKDKYYKKWYISGFQWQSLNTPFDDIPIIKLSEITNRKSLKKRVEKLERFVTEFLEFNPNFPRFAPIDYSENESLSEVAETAFKPDFENVTEAEFVLPEKYCFKFTQENYSEVKRFLGWNSLLIENGYIHIDSQQKFAKPFRNSSYIEVSFKQAKDYDFKSQSAPEKICVRRTPENAKDVNDWANGIRENKPYSQNSDYIHYDGKIPFVMCFVMEGFREITFSQFEERFLKPMEDENNEAEIGVWWNYEVGSLIFRTAKDKYFGFAHGAWVNEIQNYEIDFNGVGRKATESEVKQALEKYADENYPVGTRVKCLYSGKEKTLSEHNPFFGAKRAVYNSDEKCLWMNVEKDTKNACIYKEGTWAEILPQEETIDWSKPQLLIQNKFIVASNGIYDENSFSGMVVDNTDSVWQNLDFRNNWDKSVFKPHKYPVTINPVK